MKGLRLRFAFQTVSSKRTVPMESISIPRWAAADAGHRSAEPFVLGVADLIDQKPRPKREGVLLEIASRGTVATSHGVEKINGRADAVMILLVHRLLNDFARRTRLQSAPHMTVETHFEEAVGVLDRARLGDHNKEALLCNEKEINRC